MQEVDPTLLFVGNISFECSQRDLWRLFRDFNPEYCMVCNRNGRSVPFGRVKLSTEESAANAILALNGEMVEGNRLKVGIWSK